MDLANLIKRHLAGSDQSDALEYCGRWYKWEELRRVAAAINNHLHTAGVSAGSRVGLVARNRPAVVAAMFALIASQRRIVMIYAFQSPSALADDLRNLALPAVIADAEDWNPDALQAGNEMNCLAISLCAANGLSADTLNQPDAVHVDPALRSDAGHIAIEMLTSGTTGSPKRIPISWSTLNAAAADLTGTDPDRGAGAMAPPDVLPFPIGNISGLYYLIPAAALGRRLILMERFKLQEWLDAVIRSGSTYAAVPPAAIRMLLDSDLKAGDLGSLTAIGTGAAPLAPDQQDHFEARFQIPILIGYGATEFCGIIANWTAADHVKYAGTKRGSVGRPKPNVTIRIVDRESGAECRADAIGVIEARVPRVGNEFVRTTDLGRVDEDGFLFLHGRADEIINRGGFKVDPLKIVEAMNLHPAVADSGVVGIADDRLGQVPVAAVELRTHQPIPTESDLLAFLRDRLRSFEVPTQIRILDSLPRTPSMKVRLADLRTVFTKPISVPADPVPNGPQKR